MKVDSRVSTLSPTKIAAGIICQFKQTQHKAIEKRDRLQGKLQLKDIDVTHYGTQFLDEKMARQYCMMNATCKGVVRRKGSDIYTAYDHPHRILLHEDYEWLYIKAFSYKKHKLFLINVSGIQPQICNKGKLRCSFEKESAKGCLRVEIYHYRCGHFAQFAKCKSCAHPNWNSKCLAGIDFCILSGL